MKKEMMIAITTDKNGKEIAYRLSNAIGLRWFRIGIESAKLMLAIGSATKIKYSK
jgi:hypothetical protein